MTTSGLDESTGLPTSRVNATDAIFIALEGEDSKELNNLASQFCDKIIKA